MMLTTLVISISVVQALALVGLNIYFFVINE